MAQLHTNTICPLCRNREVELFFENKTRIYILCHNCSLVFVPQDFYLSPEEEKATYDLHINHPGDQGYRRFLSRLADPLMDILEKGHKGLDFGCGPGPTLSVMLAEAGYSMDLYDPLYFNEPSLLQNQYDFITATEVVEHFRNPHDMFDLLFTMLKPGGSLGIMTKMVIDKKAFEKWHYIQDLTHVSFFCRNTFEYLTQRYSVESEFIGNDVIFLRKSIQ